MTPSVLISMIGCGRREGTRQCLSRAIDTVKQPMGSFVLTDNASKDGTGKMFDEVAELMNGHYRGSVTVFHEKENTGFIPPGNRAFHLSVTRGLEFTVLLNDDTDPPDGWLEKLLEPFKDPTVALTCPHGTCCSLNQAFEGAGGGAFEYCEGSCLAIRNSAIASFSSQLFDENLTGIYGDDSNLSLRARERGWSIARANFHMPHIRSATTRAPEVKAFCDFHRAKNHDYNMRRFAHYLRARKFDFPIVLKRSYAIGDVLLMTPIIHAIAKSNPLSPIHVQTDFPEIFERNPYVVRASKVIEPMPDAMVIDLDGAYERLTMTHIVHGYEAEVRKQLPGLCKVELKTEMFPGPEDMRFAQKTREAALGSNREGLKLALIGSDPTTWLGKNARPSLFDEVRAHLHHEGWKTLAVGSKKGEVKTTLQQLAALSSYAQLFVGLDSAPLHIAQSVGCPTVGIFAVTRSRFIATQGSKFAAAESSDKIPSSGLRHRLTGVTYTQDGVDAAASISTGDVIAAIERLEI